MKNILYFILLFLLINCGHRSQVKEAYVQMKSAAVVFPEHAQITYNGRDSVIEDFYAAPMKQVVFIDSMNCSSCIISKLVLWKPMFDYSKSLNDAIKFYFILTPPVHKEHFVRSSLKGYILDYPVVIDVDREFLALNPHIPKDKTFHTFLLDSANNVVFVGNPLANDDIRRLFFEITQDAYKKALN